MSHEPVTTSQLDSVEGLVRIAVEQYRSKLLDLSSRNPLVNFRHSDRSRSQIRIVNEIPEILFSKLEAGRELSFEPLPEPVFVPEDESTSFFDAALRKAKRTDEEYTQALAKLGPSPSDRQKRKIERQLRDRIRVQFGLSPFTPTTDSHARARELGITPEYDLPRNNGQTARHFRDLKVQTLFFREDLDRKLGALRDSARVLLNDAGLNALYCAFGFLEYYESAAADEKRVAPLVFYPVELDRVLEDGEYRYFIRPTSGDIEVNVALAELLRQELSLELPGWKEPEDDSPALELFFSAVEKVIAKRTEWRLRRYVTVGLFTFSTLVMYKDLELQKWKATESPLESHELLRTLVAGAETRGTRFADDYDIDQIKDRDVLLVTDADSSQHSAVIDVLRGKSCVIQGPPGTGKSQTITNIIAAALYAGKTVLFVAEKMAALEVVAKRLHAAGVEKFCLELHSTKTTKSAVLGSLSSRLEYNGPNPPSQRIQSNLEALERARKDLIYYVQKTNEAAGQTGLAVHEVLLGSAKREAKRHELPATLGAARLLNAINLTQHQRAEMLAAARTLEDQTSPLVVSGRLKEHPWRGFQNSEITDFDTDELLVRLGVWEGTLQTIQQSLDGIASQIGMPLSEDIASLQEICNAVLGSSAPGVNVIPFLLPKMNRNDVRKAVDEIVSVLDKLVDAESNLRQYSTNPPSMISVGSIRLASATEGLHGLEPRCSHVSGLEGALSRAKEARKRLEKAQNAATILLRTYNIVPPNIESIRAAVLGTELLRQLSREAWFARTSAVLDERNASTIKTADARCRALVGKRGELESKVDLTSLPSATELGRYAFALKTTNPLAAVFSRDCREAKKMYRFATRKADKKLSRLQIADDLKQCAQYLSDEAQFLADKSIRSICDTEFDGLKTPFVKLIELSTWATNVTLSLAQYGQVGEQVKRLLFTGPIEELDALAGQASTDGYVTLQSVLGECPDQVLLSLEHLHEREVRAEGSIRDAITTFAAAEMLDSVDISTLKSAVKVTKQIEEYSAAIDRDHRGKDLFPWSGSELKERIGDIKKTLAYANCIASLAVPPVLVEWLFVSIENIGVARNWFEAVTVQIAKNRDAAARFDALAKLDPMLWCGNIEIERASIASSIDRCKRARATPSALRDYVSFLLAEDNACDNALGPVLNAYLEANTDYLDLPEAADLVFYRSAAEQILNDDSRLKRHSGATHEQLRKQYQELDREFLKLRRTLLSAQLATKTIPEGNYVGRVADLTELALIQHLGGQSRPRIAIRELFRRASKAIQALKPCWMMSPMSVAQFLQPGAVVFDLIVMDEASQIRPEEALGSIVRGKQLVVVGDQMQLPPTSFFQKLSADGGTEGDDEEAVDVKQESVLEAAAARFYPARRLKWHYRSEHGSLIAFSNSEFYDDDLTVFPSPHHDHPHYGIKLVQVGGQYNSGTNECEVNSIVTAAIDFMVDHPDQSLGLVAVNSKQADLIRERMDRAFADNPSAEAYRVKWDEGLESFFVKNLENVQGDERDAVFISTVYGPDLKGNFYQRFGPINSEYGHRRLNVLFTRAKKKVVLFTSMKPEDIQDEGKNWGVRALKGYIQFARDGYIALAEQGDKECDSEFEKWVLDLLRVAGFEAIPQLGFAGYRIDIAVKHPHHSGMFLCAIECDGASYHSARSVRERDRLRQEILERLGWRIYRIWSTDWFRNPNLEMAKLLDYLRKIAAQSLQ